jgi:hypothetical protein
MSGRRRLEPLYRHAIPGVAVLFTTFLSLMTGLGASAGQVDSVPTPAPAEANKAEPSGAEVEAAMRKSFAELAARDTAVRDAAREALMGLERRYLPALERLVSESRPLLPSQAAVLRQIVTHVYCAGEPYDADGPFGFLGVKMQQTTVSVRPLVNDDLEEPLPQYGVVIVERLVGFIGNRMLREGDVIVAIAEHPEVQFRNDEAFKTAVRDAGAGSTLHFHVLRRGRLVKVAVTLDPRPNAAADPQSMEDLNTARRTNAEEYWRKSFAPMLRESVG